MLNTNHSLCDQACGNVCEIIVKKQADITCQPAFIIIYIVIFLLSTSYHNVTCQKLKQPAVRLGILLLGLHVLRQRNSLLALTTYINTKYMFLIQKQ